MMKANITPLRWVNLTPHAITEVTSGRVFPPSGEVARVEVARVEGETWEGIPTFETHCGEITGLPDTEPDMVFIVSGMVKSATYGRFDVVSPGELVRNSEGIPIGCKGFVV